MYTTDASSWGNAPLFEAGPNVSVMDGQSRTLSRLTPKRTQALYSAEMRIFDFRELKKTRYLRKKWTTYANQLCLLSNMQLCSFCAVLNPLSTQG
jgi:hypothetical protein